MKPNPQIFCIVFIKNSDKKSGWVVKYFTLSFFMHCKKNKAFFGVKKKPQKQRIYRKIFLLQNSNYFMFNSMCYLQIFTHY